MVHETLIAQPQQSSDCINLLNNAAIQPLLLVDQDAGKGLEGECIFTNLEKLRDLSLFILIELRAQIMDQPGKSLFKLGMQS